MTYMTDACSQACSGHEITVNFPFKDFEESKILFKMHCPFGILKEWGMLHDSQTMADGTQQYFMGSYEIIHLKPQDQVLEITMPPHVHISEVASLKMNGQTYARALIFPAAYQI